MLAALDWVVLCATVGSITLYGAWRTRGRTDSENYFRATTLRWPTVGLSIMATQASAITFLSTPGQGYEDGLRFVQFYFGLPLAMVVISAVFVPIYYRLRVTTAYEYLEHRFDGRVRALGAILFLLQRGLAAGITIYAPSIILSSLMGWSLQATNLGMGLLVILYTVLGGTRAVAETQKHHMVVMMIGMFVTAALVVARLPDEVSLPTAIKMAGALQRINPISFEVNLESRYTFWSGMTGGFFLAMAYFGTDQSQVQRYLAGRSVAESRLGLLFNGMLKLPMQLFILFIGVMLFVFYLFTKPPIFFNRPVLERLENSTHSAELSVLKSRYDRAFAAQRSAAFDYAARLPMGAEARVAKARLRVAAQSVQQVRNETKDLIKRALPGAETKDTDYIFLSFVLQHIPSGLLGLLLAAILCAAMSSISSELTALGSTTTIDLYKRMCRNGDDRGHDLRASQLFTALWGLVAVGFATFAALLDNLVEAVNILGSIFYGTMLGIFLVAFFLPRVSAVPVFIAALLGQATVLWLFFSSELGFLWYNVVGSGIVVIMALVLERMREMVVFRTV